MSKLGATTINLPPFSALTSNPATVKTMPEKNSDSWKKLMLSMPKLLARHTGSKAIPLSGGLSALPQQGIYVLYEEDKPIYLGRAGLMQQVIKTHLAGTDTYFSLAWVLAREQAKKMGANVSARKWQDFQFHSLAPTETAKARKRLKQDPSRLQRMLLHGAERLEKESKKAIETDQMFRKWQGLVKEARKRVRRMSVRAIETKSGFETTLLGIYAELQLKACYSDYRLNSGSLL